MNPGGLMSKSGAAMYPGGLMSKRGCGDESWRAENKNGDGALKNNDP